MKNRFEKYLLEVQNELKENILPFWINNVMDKENGGFYNSVSNDLIVDKYADKGCILNSRILWTYSAAYGEFKEKKLLDTAKWAYDFLVRHFWDYEHSGLYWMTDYSGRATNDRKQLYNLAFGIYGLSEYYKASKDEAGLKKAVEIYRLIERYGRDSVNGGYFEAFTRQWLPIEDMRLSEKDLNEKKSMNTHLHILEAYANLLRVWNDKGLRESLYHLIDVMTARIIDPRTYHFRLFFDEFWNPKTEQVSYGHDIEGSWLLYEAACLLEDKGLLEKTKDIAVNMAQKVLEEGIDKKNGGVYNEAENGRLRDKNKAWWPQAEAMVGFMNAYELSGKECFFEASYDTWRFVREHLVDREYGEWFWLVSEEGRPFKNMPKVEPWKCPYHNGRACFEIVSRLKRLIDGCAVVY